MGVTIHGPSLKNGDEMEQQGIAATPVLLEMLVTPAVLVTPEVQEQ